MMFEIPVLIALTIALTEIAKRAGLNVRVAPVASVIFGIALAYVNGIEGTKEIILSGILIGTIASGFYDIGKTTLLGK